MKSDILNIFQAGPDRLRAVRKDIAEGSEPGIRFYLMVVVSTMIASFGLITNSTAVIIGAMLVAPLMTPIFGMSLALIRSDAKLLGHAVQAEVVGVAAAVGMGYLLGELYPGLEPTSEMIARTHPNLFDLLVAIFSGFAGAYALVDEKISPALPGVAIATAIVPPLANTGLCFSLGAYSGGAGSFLLFFSNFLSILLIGAIVFWIFGMAREYDGPDRKLLLKRFTIPVVSFCLIALVLYQSLIQIGHDRVMKQAIKTTLASALEDLPNIAYENSIYREEGDKVYVFANVHSARPISPSRVSFLQEQLADAIGKETELVVRSTLAQTVAALGSKTQVKSMDLDGEFVQANPHPRVVKTKLIDTEIRNLLSGLPGTELKFVQIVQRQEQDIAVAWVSGLFTPETAVIKEIEERIRKELGDPDLKLVIRFDKATLYDSDGLFQFDITGFVDLTEKQQEIADTVNSFLEAWFGAMKGATIIQLTHALVEDKLHFLVEISSLTPISVEQVQELESRILDETGEHVALHVLSKPEIISSADGYEPYEEFVKKIYKSLKPQLRKDMQKLARDSGL